MQTKFKLISGLFISIIIIMQLSCNVSTLADTNQLVLNWNVNPGDSRTYIYKNFYSIENPEGEMRSIRDERGNLIDIIYKKGLRLTYEILSIDTFIIWGKVLFNKTITTSRRIIAITPWWGILIKTTENISYLQQTIGEREDYFISSNYITYHYFRTNNNYNYEQKEIWDLKTGWLLYSSIKEWNKTQILYWMEISQIGFENHFFPSNVLFGSIILLGLCIIIIFTRYLDKKKSNRIFSR